MKVFITGATGHIGSRVVDAFLAEGHHLTALVRDAPKAEGLRSRGVKLVQGDLYSLDLIREEAHKADAVVHLAFVHDFANYPKACQTDTEVIKAVIDALEGTDKPFIATGGTAVLGPTGHLKQPVDETAVVPDLPSTIRSKSEVALAEGPARGVRAIMLRLPLYVYDKHGSGLSQIIEAKGREKGKATYTNKGATEVSVLHVEDAAAAYLAAAKHASPEGGIFHIVSGKASEKQLAEAIATRTGLPIESITEAEADEMYGFFAVPIRQTNVVDASKAKNKLGWSPKYGSQDFLDRVAGRVA